MGRRLPALLVVLWATTCLLGVAAASEGQAAPTAGGRLRRRQVETSRPSAARRQLQGGAAEEDGELEDGAVLNDQSLCRSIIAIGGWVPPRNRRLEKDDGENDALEGMIEPRIRLPDPAIEFMEPQLDVSNSSINATNSSGLSTAFAVPYADDIPNAADTDEEFVCELHDGTSLSLKGTDAQMAELRTMLNNGTLVSAESSVEAEQIESESTIGEGAGIGTGNATREYVTLPPGTVRLIHDNGRKRRRRLNRYTGQKKVLVVRVIDADGRAVPGNAPYVSDKWFGTAGDRATLTSGFAACSFGQFVVTNDYGPSFPYEALSAPGVLEVRIDVRLPETTQETLRNRAAVATQQKLGILLPGPFDHVAFAVEKCYAVSGGSCAFAAYAYVNHWLSLYVEDNYIYPGVQMHEIGHNLNLAHSGGLDGRTYTDHTCLMGNPLWSDDEGKMCFNPVKNYQIAMAGSGWYGGERIQVFDTGATGGTSWRGRIVGVAEFNRNSDHPIVVKIETGRSDDWFLGLNRAVGPHADNKQASDRLTVHTVQAGNGLSYSTSALKGTLGQLQQGTIANWRGSGQELKIKVNAINTDVIPGYADVEISFGPQTIGPIRLSGSTNKCMTAADPVSTGNVYMDNCRANDSSQIFHYDKDTMEIRRGALCLDSSLHTPNVYLYNCNGGNNQKWTYDWRYQQMTTLHEKATKKRCLDMNTNAGANNNLYMHRCHGGNNQKLAIPSSWDFPRQVTQIKTYADASKCMDADPVTQSLSMASCQDGSPNQLFAYNPSSMEMKQGGRCVSYNVLNNDAEMQDCNGQKNQMWIYNWQSFEFRTVQNNRCLDMKLDGTGNLYMNHQCNGLWNQKFAQASNIVFPFPQYTKRLRVYANKNKCMEAAPNKNLYMNACRSEGDSPGQLFSYNPTTMEIKQGDLCVDYNWYTNNVYLHPCHGKDNQKWLYDFQTSQLKSRRDGKCLDMRLNGSGNLYMYGCFEAENQRFTAAFASPPGLAPTPQPSRKPTKAPTPMPTKLPTRLPTESPSSGPTRSPSTPPFASPSKAPSQSPSSPPTSSPSSKPTEAPQAPAQGGGAAEGGVMSMSLDYMDMGLTQIPADEAPVFGRRNVKQLNRYSAKGMKRKRA